MISLFVYESLATMDIHNLDSMTRAKGFRQPALCKHSNEITRSENFAGFCKYRTSTSECVIINISGTFYIFSSSLWEVHITATASASEPNF